MNVKKDNSIRERKKERKKKGKKQDEKKINK